MTCHKLMRTDPFRSLPLRERGFGIEPQITARLLRSGARIYEVPVTYTSRDRDHGKKLTALDGLRVARTLARCRFGQLECHRTTRATRPVPMSTIPAICIPETCSCRTSAASTTVAA